MARREATAPVDRLSFAAVEAEREVLGAVLLSNELFYCGPESLTPECFSTSLHRLVFAEIKRLITAGAEATPFAVWESLQTAGLLHSADWHVISDLTTMPVVCCPASVEGVSRTVREAARRARFVASVEAATQQQYDSAQALDETIATLQRELAGFDQPSAEQADRTGMKALESSLVEIGARQAAGKAISGLPTGLPSVDRATSGLGGGEYSIVAAWTAQGKSAFALGAALATVKTGADVAYFSLEMSAEELMDRALAALTRTDYSLIREPSRMHTEKLEELIASRKSLAFLDRLHLDDRGGLSINALQLAARRMIARYHVRLIVVDYLQLVHAEGERDPRLRVNAVSGALRELAKSTHVPILAVSQLSRPKDADEVPTIFHLKESGNLEQDAHRVLLLHRPMEDGHYSGQDFVIIGKQRAGLTGRQPVQFNGRFVSWEERQ